jgi:amino acid transporter
LIHAGTASVARGYSNYLDALLGKRMQAAFKDITPIHEWVNNSFVAEYLSAYFDFFALTLCVVLSALLSFGVKESSKFNNVFTVLNLLVVLYVIAVGSFKGRRTVTCFHGWSFFFL